MVINRLCILGGYTSVLFTAILFLNEFYNTVLCIRYYMVRTSIHSMKYGHTHTHLHNTKSV